MTGLFALQKAIYARLNGALPCGVYDDVPEDAQLPYAVIGDGTSAPWGSKDLRGVECVATLNFYSGYGGMKEVDQLMDRALELLRAPGLEVEGWEVVVFGLELANPVVDEDGTRHGVLRVRVKMLEA